MPRGAYIEDQEILKRFRLVVQASLTFSLNVNKNFILFEKLIYEKTQQVVSVSTLKRIFLYPAKSKPTLYTLDLICKTIGINDWNEFVNAENLHAEHKYQEVITMIRVIGYQDFNDFKKMISENIHTHGIFEITLALIKVAVQRNDFEVLSQLFDLPVFQVDINFYPPQFYFAQELGLILRESPIIKKLIPIYAKSPVAQIWYIERFVDEDNLDGYYGDMLEMYHIHKKNLEAQLFYHSLMCLRDMDNHIFTSKHLDFMLQFRETEPVHFLPKIRRLALLLYYFKEDAEVKESIQEEIALLIANESTLERSFMAVVISRIIFMTGDYRDLKRSIGSLNLPQKAVNDSINYYRDINILKIYEAYILLGEGKLQEAKAKLATYNPSFLCPYQHKKFVKDFRAIDYLINIEIEKTTRTES